jgi:dATP pyrophosphohydrolase
MPQSDWRRPESVLVVIFTRALDCLLLERRRPAGFWQSVTGGLEWGETPLDAAIREVHEETRLPSADLAATAVEHTFAILPEWRSRYAPDVRFNREYLWYLELAQRQPVTLNRDEHVAYEWLPLEEAIDRVSSWTNRQALESLRNRH